MDVAVCAVIRPSSWTVTFSAEAINSCLDYALNACASSASITQLATTQLYDRRALETLASALQSNTHTGGRQIEFEPRSGGDQFDHNAVLVLQVDGRGAIDDCDARRGRRIGA